MKHNGEGVKLASQDLVKSKQRLNMPPRGGGEWDLSPLPFTLLSPAPVPSLQLKPWD